MSENIFNKQKEIFDDTLTLLENANVLEHIIIVGSWAEYIYKESGLLDIPTTLKTQDIDLLIPNIRRPNKKIDLVETLRENNFLLHHSIDGLMKFNKGGVIDIEFLVREMGAGKMDPYKVDSLGVTAQVLRHLEVLTDNTTKIQYNNLSVIVPRPGAYVLHKLIINKFRNENKKQKDIRAVKDILKLVEKSHVELYALQKIYNRLTAKELKYIKNTCKENNINIKGINNSLFY